MREEDVARSRPAGAAAEIHDALTSGTTAAVTLLREDLDRVQAGAARAPTRPRLRRGHARDALRSPAIAMMNEKLAELRLDMVARWPGRRCG
jgi:hypothetical protein